MWVEKSSQLHMPNVAQLSQATACHHVKACPARNVTATLIYSVMSIMPHTIQYYSRLKSQSASFLVSPSNLAGLLSFNYAAILPMTICSKVTYAVAVAAYTAENAACHLPHTSATMSLTSCDAILADIVIAPETNWKCQLLLGNERMPNWICFA